VRRSADASTLVSDEEVSVTVTRASARKAPRQSDPWIEIRGTLSPDEADEMIRAIHTNRRNKSSALEIDAL
jgi:hypothetical protein